MYWYIAGSCVSWLIIQGWLFAEMQGSYPEVARREAHTDAGISSLVAMLLASLWPIGLVVALCLTGFANHGWRPIWAKIEGSKQ